MNIYKFRINYKGELEKEVFECEEKPKSYSTVSRCSSRILKSDIGKTTGYGNNEVCLLEDDVKMAALLIVEKKERIYESKLKDLEKLQECIKYLRGIVNE